MARIGDGGSSGAVPRTGAATKQDAAAKARDAMAAAQKAMADAKAAMARAKQTAALPGISPQVAAAMTAGAVKQAQGAVAAAQAARDLAAAISPEAAANAGRQFLAIANQAKQVIATAQGIVGQTAVDGMLHPVAPTNQPSPAATPTTAASGQTIGGATIAGPYTGAAGTYGFESANLSQMPQGAGIENFGYVTDFAAQNPEGTWSVHKNPNGDGTFYRFTTPTGDYRETSVLPNASQPPVIDAPAEAPDKTPAAAPAAPAAPAEPRLTPLEQAQATVKQLQEQLVELKKEIGKGSPDDRQDTNDAIKDAQNRLKIEQARLYTLTREATM